MRIVETILILSCSAAATKTQKQQHKELQRHRSLSLDQQCSVCGEAGPSSVPFPDKQFLLNGIPLDTCGQVETSAALLNKGSVFCEAIQTVGPLCGCAVSPTACTLCWDGSPVTNPNLELTSYPAEDFLATSLPGVLLTCELLDSILQVRDEEDDAQCLNIRIDAGEMCGCPSLPNDQVFIATNTSDPPKDETNDDEDDDTSIAHKCSLCPNGEAPRYPDKPLNLVGSTSYTCSDWDRFASVADANDCSWLQAFSKYCGCHIPNPPCTMCPLGEAVPKPNRPLNWYDTGFVSTRASYFHSELDVDYLTCEIMDSKIANGRSTYASLLGKDEEFVCMSVQLKSSICGCRPDWRPILLTWSYRLSGILSFVGSSLIMYDVLRRSKNRFTAYHQLVLGISVFDCISSMAYILVGVLAPHEAGFHQSLGNDTTCKVQGFMIQLGQTSMFYNLCLSLYFLLVVCFNWKERQIKIWKWVVHGVVLTVGFGMAFGALPFISAQFGVCGILPPLTADQWQASLFYTAPVCIVLLILTAVTVMICLYVYKKHRRVRKWMVESNRKLSLTRKVFWQSFWYVMAFYLTLPCVLVTFYVEFTSKHHFWLLVVAALLAPLQGLMNALVYFQRSRGTAFWRWMLKYKFSLRPMLLVQGLSATACSAAGEKAEASGVIDSKVCEFGSEAVNSQIDASQRPQEEEEGSLDVDDEMAEVATFATLNTQAMWIQPSEEWVESESGEISGFFGVVEYWHLNEQS